MDATARQTSLVPPELTQVVVDVEILGGSGIRRHRPPGWARPTCGVVFGLGSWFLLQGQELDNARLEQKWHRLQNQANEGKAAFKARPLFREEVGRLEQEAERWRPAAPAEGGLSELLLHLGEVGTRRGVTVEHHDGDGPESARITVSGSRQRLRGFFGALSGDLYPFVAGDLEISVVEGTEVLKAELVVSPALGPRD